MRELINIFFEKKNFFTLITITVNDFVATSKEQKTLKRFNIINRYTDNL